MIDEILDMFGRKRRSSGTKPAGLGGILARVQDAMEGDDDRHRAGHGRYHRDDAPRRDHDTYDVDNEPEDRRGRRRGRDGFDFGDD